MLLKAARTRCLTPGSSLALPPGFWELSLCGDKLMLGLQSVIACVGGWGGEESLWFHYFPTYDFCLTYIIYRKTETCYPQGITFCGFTNGWISDLVIVSGLKAFACFDQRLTKCTLKWVLARQTSAH